MTLSCSSRANGELNEKISKLKAIICNSDLSEPLTKENAIDELSKLYQFNMMPNEYADLLLSLTNSVYTGSISKAKLAKILRNLLEEFSNFPDSTLTLQIDTCKQLIKWSVEEKKMILKKSFESILISKYLHNGQFQDAISLIDTLSMELKKIDDKQNLVEVLLLESKVFFQLKNIPKAKASLTSAKSCANSIYCQPLVQAALDMHSGILHAEEKDFKTAYSYFFEAFDSYSNMEHELALSALKYMLLSKIMLNNIEDVNSIIAGKTALKYSGETLEALKCISAAYKNRSLAEFDSAMKFYQSHLLNDDIMKRHLNDLYENLLENNIRRVIEPYTRVEISHVASVVGLDKNLIEKK